MAKKHEDIDEDFVVAPMNVEGMPWYNKHKNEKKPEVDISRKDAVKMIFRMYLVLIPILALFIGAAALFIYFLCCVW